MGAWGKQNGARKTNPRQTKQSRHGQTLRQTCSAGRPALDKVGGFDVPVDIARAVHLLQGVQHAQACSNIRCSTTTKVLAKRVLKHCRTLYCAGRNAFSTMRLTIDSRVPAQRMLKHCRVLYCAGRVASSTIRFTVATKVSAKRVLNYCRFL